MRFGNLAYLKQPDCGDAGSAGFEHEWSVCVGDAADGQHRDPDRACNRS